MGEFEHEPEPGHKQYDLNSVCSRIIYSVGGIFDQRGGSDLN
jgi:hypothetical protein